MRCPACDSVDNRVLESRLLDGETSLRRRRECGACKNRFTTYERMESTPLMVIKRDESRQPFDPIKIMKGLNHAAVKCPIPGEVIESIPHEIEAALTKRAIKEVTTAEIGEMVLERLRKVNEVAYVRFASVYRKFGSIEDFVRELANLTPARPG